MRRLGIIEWLLILVALVSLWPEVMVRAWLAKSSTLADVPPSPPAWYPCYRAYLIGVLAVMAVVAILRIRRLRRAFRDEQTK